MTNPIVSKALEEFENSDPIALLMGEIECEFAERLSDYFRDQLTDVISEQGNGVDVDDETIDLIIEECADQIDESLERYSICLHVEPEYAASDNEND